MAGGANDAFPYYLLVANEILLTSYRFWMCMTDGQTERECEKSFCNESRQGKEDSRHMFLSLFFIILGVLVFVFVSMFLLYSALQSFAYGSYPK